MVEFKLSDRQSFTCALSTERTKKVLGDMQDCSKFFTQVNAKSALQA